VRHIFERLIRKFSYERLDQYFPEQDKKLILNIKKRRESLKKRAIANREGGEQESEEQPRGKQSAKPKFEEALHDSDSDLGSEEEDYIPDQYKDETFSSKKVSSICLYLGEICTDHGH
jgi:ribosomal RNA-processing protein 12